MVRIPTIRTPTHPGEMLLEEFLNPMDLTQRELADRIHVPFQRINDIVNGRRGITPSTALRMGKFFNMSADFWMNLQLRWDLYFAWKNKIGIFKKNLNADLQIASIMNRPRFGVGLSEVLDGRTPALVQVR